MTYADDWGRWPCLGFDLETNSPNPLDAWPVTASLVRCKPGEEPVAYEWLIRPDGWVIPDEAAAIHGITTEHALEHGQPIDEVLAEVTEKLAAWLERRFPVAAMNASYDFTVLEATTIRRRTAGSLVWSVPGQLGGRRMVAPVVDPFVLDRHADKYRKGSRKLVDLAALYGVPLDNAHESSSDALAAVRLWPKIIAAHPDKFRGMTLKALHLAQIQWKREQIEGLEAYHRQQGKLDGDYDRGWPYLTTLPAEVRS